MSDHIAGIFELRFSVGNDEESLRQTESIEACLTCAVASLQALLETVKDGESFAIGIAGVKGNVNSLQQLIQNLPPSSGPDSDGGLH